MTATIATIALATTTVPTAEVTEDGLLARLARPGADATHFVEVRYSKLLQRPLVVEGTLEHRNDGALVRRVDQPFQEVMELDGDTVRVQRSGAKPRSFSLDRAPELRGLLASFDAILKGDRQMLDHHFEVTVRGTDARWQISMVPREDRLRQHLALVTVDGSGDQPSCFALTEPDGDESVMALGVAAASQLPSPMDRDALRAWCTGSGRP